MDIGSIVSWIQAAIWIFAGLLWIGRIARGEVTMHPWLKRILSSNGLIGAVILLGLISTGISFYITRYVYAIPSSLEINISAYEPQYPAPMRVIADQTFEDVEVPLDGHIYQRCTFSNVCFVYDGGAYGIQNSTVKNHSKVCVKQASLRNYLALMEAMRMMSPKSEHTKKTIITNR